MDLQAMFTDNQIAVFGCFAALIICGGIAALSFQFGPAGRRTQDDSADSPVVGSLPEHRQPARRDSARRAA